MSKTLISIELEGLEEVQALMNKIPESTYENAKLIFRRNALELHDIMTDRSTSGPLRRRTGGLARSWQPRTSGSDISKLKSLVASFISGSPTQSPVIYAPIHEFGGTIRAKKRNGFLTIPTEDNNTAAGVMRQSAREVIDGGGHFAGGVIVSADDKVTHVMKRSVTIKARLGFFAEGNKQVVKLTKDLEGILAGL